MKKLLTPIIPLIATSFVFSQQESTVISQGLSLRDYMPIHEEEFSIRSQKYFNIKKVELESEQLTVGRESFVLYPKNGFLVPTTESIFENADPNKPPYTADEIASLFQDTTHWLTNRIVAYNKLLFNDDESTTSYFLENIDDANEVVVDYGYDQNLAITRYVIEELNLESVDIDVLQKLFFYAKDGSFRIKIAEQIIELKDPDFVKQLAQNLIESWNKLPENAQKLDAVIYLLRGLNHPENVENMHDRYDYVILEKLLDKNLSTIKNVCSNRFTNHSVNELLDSYKTIKGK